MLIIDITQLVIPEHKKGRGTHLTELPPKFSISQVPLLLS